MDIEFIPLEDRQNVFKIMEVCGVDMKQAYELYTASGNNFEASINRHFNPQPQQPQIPPQQVYNPDISHQNMGQQYFDPHGQFYQEEEDVQFSHYKQFRRNGKTFDKKYPVRPHQTFFKSMIPKFFKGGEDNPFKKSLQQYIKKHTNLKNDGGNLSEAFNWCWKEKFPMAVILLDFSANAFPSVQRLFSQDLLIQKVISEQFKAYGINTKEYELEAQLKPFFNFQRDANSIVICRVNHLDQINIVTRIGLDQPTEDIKKKIKQAKSACIQNELDQSHIARQYTEQLRGNFNYQRPKTIKESIKQRQDKKLRRQQEQQFFKACQPKAKEQQKPNQQYQQERPQKQEIKPQINNPYKQQIKPEIRQPKEQIKSEVKKPPVPSISPQKILKMRQQKLFCLKKYDSGITFKIRLPSGSNIMLTVSAEQFIQYLFTYIQCQPDQLGFSDELNRKFDIYIGFGGSQTLKGKEARKIKQIFQDSEVLIVREL